MPSHPDHDRPQPVFAPVLALVAVLGLVIWGAVGVWGWAARAGFAQLETQARADLRLAADRLTSALAQFRAVAVLAAEQPQVVTLADRARSGTADPGTDRAALGAVLRRIADRSGAREILLTAPDGRVLAGPPEAPAQLAPHADITRAAQGALGAWHGVDPETGLRIFRFAAPVFAADGPVTGIVVLTLEAERVEAPGRGDPTPVWFTDAAGVSFLANRSELVFGLDGPFDPVAAAGAYPSPETLRPLRLPKARLAGRDLVAGRSYLPALGLPVSLDLPVIAMTAHGLADADGVVRSARTQALSVALAALGAAAMILTLWERRRALARANIALEHRVAERTAELERAQADLVQAGKLSALGQMSAGISHELNQPLMAIRSYAENAELLLERGRDAEAAANLGKISEMARRMGRIIKNLRAFARAEGEPAARVGLASVVEGALEMMEPRIARAGVRVDWARPTSPAIVMGGEVRLGQVVVNLISNALEAMEGLPAGAPRRLTLRIAPAAPGRIALTIRDSGPGILDPGRIFDPFYSTKEVGTEEGLGLGLSISYGLVQGFGGTLSWGNAPEGGALFTVDLRAADPPRGAASGEKA